MSQAPLLSPKHIRNTAVDNHRRTQIDQAANKMIQWLEHLRSTTDYIVPPEVNHVLDLAPRLRIIHKNMNNVELVNRIVNAPEPSKKGAILVDDDSVRLYSSYFHSNTLIHDTGLARPRRHCFRWRGRTLYQDRIYRTRRQHDRRFYRRM